MIYYSFIRPSACPWVRPCVRPSVRRPSVRPFVRSSVRAGVRVSVRPVRTEDFYFIRLLFGSFVHSFVKDTVPSCPWGTHELFGYFDS